jgi:hypothetical protein
MSLNREVSYSLKCNAVLSEIVVLLISELMLVQFYFRQFYIHGQCLNITRSILHSADKPFFIICRSLYS